MNINIIVEIDFEGFFEIFTQRLFTKIENPNIKQINITAGPWKSSDVSFGFDSETGTLSIIYYSAVRVFGWSFDTNELITEFNNLR